MVILDIDKFDVKVDGFEPSPDGSTFIYFCHIRLGSRAFRVEKRFSDFHALHNALFTQEYAALPQIPAKSLTRPNDPATAEMRMTKLNTYLRACCARPDIRQSQAMTKFLAFDLELNVPPIEIKLVTLTNTTEFGSFSVVDFSFNYKNEFPLYVTAMSDTTALSKLGKAWSVIEPEYVGGIAIYAPVPNSLTKVALSSVFNRSAQKRINVARFIPDTNVLLVGDSDGALSLYSCTSATNQTVELSVLGTHAMHMKATFVQLVESVEDPYKFASIGSDNGLRLFRINRETASIEILSSGRVVRPLKHPKETITSLALLEARWYSKAVEDPTRMLVGTSAGQIFVYSVTEHPPKFLGALNLCVLIAYLEDEIGIKQINDCVQIGIAVKHVQLIRHEECAEVIIAVTGLILILDIEPFLTESPQLEFAAILGQVLTKSSENTAERRGRRSPLNHVKRILRCPVEADHKACVSALYWHEYENILIVSYQRGICVWHIDSGRCLQCLDKLRWGTIRKLDLLPLRIDGGIEMCLMAATSLGGLRVLQLGTPHEWRIWSPGLAAELPTEVEELGEAKAEKKTAETINQFENPDSDIIEEIYASFQPARY